MATMPASLAAPAAAARRPWDCLFCYEGQPTLDFGRWARRKAGLRLGRMQLLASRGRYRETGSRLSGAPRPGFAVTAWVMLAMGALIAVTVWGQFTARAVTGLLALDVAVGIAAWLLVLVLLRWPVAGALALAALAALSPAATPAATVGTLHVAGRRRFAVAATVGGAGIVAHAIRGLWRPIGGLPFGWWLILVVVGESALVGWGAWAQARRGLLSSLVERARRAEEEQGRRVAEARIHERTRIAREMHDVL